MNWPRLRSAHVLGFKEGGGPESWTTPRAWKECEPVEPEPLGMYWKASTGTVQDACKRRRDDGVGEPPASEACLTWKCWSGGRTARRTALAGRESGGGLLPS